MRILSYGDDLPTRYDDGVTGETTFDEHGFIGALRALVSDPAARGLADDCAVIDFGGEALVLTHDMMARGVHWLPDQDPADVAWKLVSSNLSDLAAKGAEPIGVLLGYTLAGGDDRFLIGLGEALEAFAVPLLGGDTIGGVANPVHGLTALGRATFRPVPSRAGARAGDGIWITGVVGAAMLGFEALRDRTGADSLAFRRPAPRLAEGIALAPLVTAMMDVSDGLLLDASRMATTSQATFALESASIPIAVAEARRQDAIRWGEDYQLLFTLPGPLMPPIPAHRIGVVRSGPGQILLDGKTPAGTLGFEHHRAK